MSRGRYTDAVDMWGLGCIFGEMLSRMAYVGSAANARLRVGPLFAVRDLPSTTPLPGETFTNTKKELDALFKVIGTPSWKDIDGVEMVEWRRYLEKLPGRAPTVMRRFKYAGEVAIHLLMRLLEFDPGRRLTCDEAMLHEYFASRDMDGDWQAGVDGSCHDLKMEEAVERQLRVCDQSVGESSEQPDQEIGEALDTLEKELDEILHERGSTVDDRNSVSSDFFSDKSQRLLKMLEEECDAVQRTMEQCSNLQARKQRSSARRRKTTLIEDSRMDQCMDECAHGRMSNVADTWAGKELDASKFLRPNRHGEWSEWSAERAGNGRRAATASGWGVSTTPVGGNSEFAEAIRQQQMK
jgi:serine/threonine protein kinase